MATVEIDVWSGGEHYSIRLEYDELNSEVWGSDKSHIDRVLDRAVAQIKQAYRSPYEPEGDKER